MPVIEVKLYDRRVTEESVPKMIEALTQALHESSGAAVEHIQVDHPGRLPEALGHRRQAAGLSRGGLRRRWRPDVLIPTSPDEAGSRVRRRHRRHGDRAAARS